MAGSLGNLYKYYFQSTLRFACALSEVSWQLYRIVHVSILDLIDHSFDYSQVRCGQHGIRCNHQKVTKLKH